LIEAAGKESDLDREIAKRYEAMPNSLGPIDLRRGVPNDLFKDPQEAKQTVSGNWDWSKASPMRLTRKELRAVLLNAGNSSNLQKLSDGYGVKPEQVMEWLDRYATKEDWDWAQAHWDIFKELKGMSDAMYRRLRGVAPESVNIQPITTKHGVYAGGYHPLIYHPLAKSKMLADVDEDALFGPNYNRAAPPASYTLARTDFVGPLTLSLDEVPARISQEIHDITFREAIVNAAKIIYDPRFYDGVYKNYGKEFAELFVPWLRDIANTRNYMSANQWAGEQWFNYLRQNSVGTLVGGNMRTVQKHTISALISSAKEVGADNLVQAYLSLNSDSGTGVSNWDFAMEKSPELRRRHTSWMEQVSGVTQTALEGKSFRQTMLYLGTWPVAKLDLMSAVPMWLAGYKKAIDDKMSEKDAIYFADRAVQRAHGSSAIPLRPEVMRRYPGVTQMYNFMNRQANYQYELAWKAAEDIGRVKKGQKPEYSQDLILGLFTDVILPGMVDTLVSEIKPDDNWQTIAAKSMATGVTAPWVGIREASHFLMSGMDPSLGIAAEELKVVVEFGRDLLKKEAFNKEHMGNTFKHANNLIGVFTGMTNAEIGNLGKFLIDLKQGKINPKTAADYWRGITKGNPYVHHPDLVEQVLEGTGIFQVFKGGKK